MAESRGRLSNALQKRILMRRGAYENPAKTTPTLDPLRVERGRIRGQWQMEEQPAIRRDSAIDDAPIPAKGQGPIPLTTLRESESLRIVHKPYNEWELAGWLDFPDTLDKEIVCAEVQCKDGGEPFPFGQTG
jgi:hypothetical protein